jgi:Mrp family chromosome partitioning ATPase
MYFSTATSVKRIRAAMADKFDTRPWARSVTKLLGFAEKSGARIVGVTGQTSGVGTSLLSNELAHTYTEFGKPTLLVNASRLEIDRSTVSENRDLPFDLLGMAHRSNTGLSAIDLADFSNELPSGRAAFKKMFEAVSAQGITVVVDLAPVSLAPGAGVPAFMVTGAACEMVFLVCLSGAVTKAELADCHEICKINGVKLGGIVPNDWLLPASSLLD